MTTNLPSGIVEGTQNLPPLPTDAGTSDLALRKSEIAKGLIKDHGISESEANSMADMIIASSQGKNVQPTAPADVSRGTVKLPDSFRQTVKRELGGGAELDKLSDQELIDRAKSSGVRTEPPTGVIGPNTKDGVPVSTPLVNDATGSTHGQPLPKIVSAVAQVGDKQYEGASHEEALNQGGMSKKTSEEGKDWQARFKTTDGRLITRDQAKSEFGISHSEEVPELKAKQDEQPEKSTAQKRQPVAAETDKWRGRGRGFPFAPKSVGNFEPSEQTPELLKLLKGADKNPLLEAYQNGHILSRIDQAFDGTDYSLRDADEKMRAEFNKQPTARTKNFA